MGFWNKRKELLKEKDQLWEKLDEQIAQMDSLVDKYITIMNTWQDEIDRLERISEALKQSETVLKSLEKV